MKVEYNEGDGALESGKIEERWRLNTSKISKMEVRYKQDRSKMKIEYNKESVP